MPSYRPTILPPRLLNRARRAFAPSLLLGGGLMLLLPLAQVINAAPGSEKRPPVVIHQAPPSLIEVPDPPEDPEPDEVPVEPLEEPLRLPDPYLLEVHPNLDGIARYADYTQLGGFDQGQFDGDIEDWANLTVAPQVLAQIDPQYPADLKSAGIEGDVRVKFLIKADGSVARITVLKSSDSRFSDAAVRAVRRWQFQPGEKSGRAVAVWALQTIPFRIH